MPRITCTGEVKLSKQRGKCSRAFPLPLCESVCASALLLLAMSGELYHGSCSHIENCKMLFYPSIYFGAQRAILNPTPIPVLDSVDHTIYISLIVSHDDIRKYCCRIGEFVPHSTLVKFTDRKEPQVRRIHSRQALAPPPIVYHRLINPWQPWVVISQGSLNAVSSAHEPAQMLAVSKAIGVHRY